MRDRLWSSVLTLVVIACLLFPVALLAADASAATAVDPNNASTTAAPANSGASVGPGSVINPSLLDLLVRDNAQKGRLFQLNGKSLPQRAVKHRITRSIREIS